MLVLVIVIVIVVVIVTVIVIVIVNVNSNSQGITNPLGSNPLAQIVLKVSENLLADKFGQVWRLFQWKNNTFAGSNPLQKGLADNFGQSGQGG